MPFPFVAAALLASSAVSAYSAHNTNKKQISAADRQMAFQADMSNTAHQREVEDLKKAGLNPILSSKYGGASTPSGAMPNIRDLAEGLASNALQASKVKKEIDLLDEQTELVRTQKDKVEGEADSTKVRGWFDKLKQQMLKDVLQYLKAPYSAYKIQMDKLERKRKGVDVNINKVTGR